MKRIIDTSILLLIAVVPLLFFAIWSAIIDKNVVDNTVMLICAFVCIGVVAHLLFTPIKLEVPILKFRIFLIGGLLGTVFFVAIFGLKIVYPTNIAWIMYHKANIDLIQHFLGWHYFRYEAWTFPIGNINAFGAPVGTSVAHTDALPILAIPFKLIRNILPENFQYMGMWVLFCYFLQGALGALLVNLFTDDVLLIFLGAIFFVISPIMRMPDQCALSAHWAILYAIWLNFTKVTKKNHHWLSLLLALALIHPYLYVMCFGLYFADSVTRILQKTSPNKQFLKELFIILSCSAILFWLVGYFQLGFEDLGSPLFGSTSMNLNALFNPSFMNGNYSIFLNQLKLASFIQFEGFSYLGLGVISLLVSGFLITIPKIAQTKSRELKKYLPIAIVMVLFFIFALSNKVTLNDHILFEFPIPALLKSLCNIFRASGRFIWPVYYLIICFAIWIVVGSKKLKYGYKIFLILCAVFVQFMDFSGMFRSLQSNFKAERVWSTALKSAKWEYFANKYNKIMYIPNYKSATFNLYTYFTPPDDYEDFTFFAAKHNMSVSSGYFARTDYMEMQKSSNNIMRSFMQGNLDLNAIFIIRNNKILDIIIKNNAYKNICVMKIDKYYVAIKNDSYVSECLTRNELSLISSTPSVNGKGATGK